MSANVACEAKGNARFSRSRTSQHVAVIEGEKHGEARIRSAQCNIRGTTGCGGATLRREDRGFVASASLGHLRLGSSRAAPRRVSPRRRATTSL